MLFTKFRYASHLLSVYSVNRNTYRLLNPFATLFPLKKKRKKKVSEKMVSRGRKCCFSHNISYPFKIKFECLNNLFCCLQMLCTELDFYASAFFITFPLPKCFTDILESHCLCVCRCIHFAHILKFCKM